MHPTSPCPESHVLAPHDLNLAAPMRGQLAPPRLPTIPPGLWSEPGVEDEADAPVECITIPAPPPFGLPALELEMLQRLAGQLDDAIDLGDEKDEPLRSWMRLASRQVHEEIERRG